MQEIYSIENLIKFNLENKYYVLTVSLGCRKT